nr:FAD-binding protein [Candidatus Sigynarchaeota archaeon]
AYRAGARIANMEFFQFHPTCLYHHQAKSFLISEALRGEGAVLMNNRGERFAFKYHEKGELAPRDVVSRAIDQEMKEHGLDCVYLDISFKPKDFITSRFPNIYKRCLEYGFDLTEQPIPVVPAAHFTCGGVMAGIDGTTNVNGLLAIGEVACTGFHGANRLASNSLLECVVCADFTSKHIKQAMETTPLPIKQVRNWDPGKAKESREAVVVKHDWDEVRTLMWNYVGIVRSVKNLARAKSRLDIIMNEIRDYYWQYLLTADLVELRHVVQVAELIVQCAMARQESRGTHFIVDFPNKLTRAQDTTLQRKDA